MPKFRALLRLSTAILALGEATLVSGCAASPAGNHFIGCPVVTSLLPDTATANHAAMSPGNEAQFVMGTGNVCISLLARQYPVWTNPDPINIVISSAADDTNGIATCKGPTSGPVTLSAAATVSGKVVVETAALSCQ